MFEDFRLRFSLSSGFKATQVHKACVANRTQELMSLFQLSNESDVAAMINVTDEGVATGAMGGIGEIVTYNVTECSLTKELDNVSGK